MSVMRSDGPRDLDTTASFEGDIRDFVRKDISRKSRNDPARTEPARPQMPRADAPRAEEPRAERREATPNPTRDQINNLLRGVCGASMEEIDRVILELQSVREMLRHEGERVHRELTGYASLNQAALTAMKIIGESLTQWKAAPAPRPDSH